MTGPTGTPRDPSPSSTVTGAVEPTQPTTPSDRHPRATSGQTSAPKSPMNEKTKMNMSEKGSSASSTSSKEYEERGIIEVDHDGTTRKVKVVVEDKTGKEQFKDAEGGPYSQPRWRHSLPFMKPKYPPPPPPMSLDDAKLTPEVSANWFSFLYFNWVSPMMALGDARPLEATDLWRMDEKRSAGRLAGILAEKYEERKKSAEEYNARLADPRTPLPRRQRIFYPLLPHREKREADFRTKKGKKKASLAMALLDVFGWWFWMAGVLKIIGDCSLACSPLLIRALIRWSTKNELHRKGLPVAAPKIGDGVGMAIGLFFMLSISSLTLHHYFYRTMGTGVLARSALISAIYERALRFTQKSRSELPNGKITNHISTDTARIDFAAGFVHILWTAPIQFIIITVILIVELGYSAVPGIMFLLIMTPGQAIIMKKLFEVRKKSMVWTDKRAKLLQEILGGMRLVKFFAWEKPFLERLSAVRRMELGYVRTLLIVRSGMMAFAMSLPVLATILAFVTYSLTAHDLQPATIFTSVTLFNLMRMPLMMWPMTLSATADAINALGRLQAVFDAEVTTDERVIDPDLKEAVLIKDASFTWDAAPPIEDEVVKLEAKLAAAQKGVKPAGKSPKKSKDKEGKKSGIQTPAAGPQGNSQDDVFQLKDINLSIPSGSLTAIVGPIGSGKSSLLQGLMGEMRRTSGSVKFQGTTALCAQTPWIQNATVRENILFGQPWNEDKYWAAVRDASLEPDLELLEDGDGTEIGEKGITLSGGQKQRVNIARALYFDSDIIALDDPLSALDAGVGKQVFFNAILGALAGKTRILVTHALHFLPHVDNIIMLDNGRVCETGTYQELKDADGPFSRLVREFGSEDVEEKEAGDEEEAIEEDNGPHKPIDRSKMTTRGLGHGMLMQLEERNQGSLQKGTFSGYLRAGKGYIMLPLLLIAVVIGQGFTVMSQYWLVWWQQGEWGLSNNAFMGAYAALGIGQALGVFLIGSFMSLINFFASVTIHRDAIKSVMYAPQSFFDTTPLGRIMNRFSKDIDTIDNTLSDAARMSLNMVANVIGAVVLLAVISPWFLIAVAVVFLLYYHCAQYYRASSREFKRVDAILRSSLYSHFSESLSGISTIRAYGEGKRFIRENVKRMDVENRGYYMTIINQRWLGIRLDMLGSLLTFAVALIVVLNNKVSAAHSGLGLSTMLTIQQVFSWLVRQLAEVENDMVGAERIMYYANNLEQEPPHEVPDHKPDASWPAQGEISFDNVVMKYRPELPDVLKGLTIHVKPSEKIGIVGRTGAGKSSIMAALFRITELSSGSITIDNVNIADIGLDQLRSHISIIPQDPLLFSGTLRSNIDPFSRHTDAELYDALKRAHLIPSTTYDASKSGDETPVSRFNLDYVVEEEGGNLSVGERSLVSLARALIRDSKVLVLDEATASVDVETDSKIQETIRQEFGNKTLLCIAHRLRTILSYDRILVMSDGAVEEFDTPENLFNSRGHFYEMCQKSGISLEDIRYYASLRFSE
ncbi:uncharacterized protein CcaverHIS019_0406010 [Cutaneotrichosporon cavernicola]|uniref:Uncharacterized protein n=1 Tax=Cutaneotrichosporon cavernicola TaxID=279322 RepID=A0AA48L4F9_9TREE|nr:uncharacterized protein CcaverHIS019_0406010 [Cutaneotrichosporon cavernicola]BEI91781.1 hypothetical protein CcaverHIS019_0406010 [Cutaneotrichosporon cavernicola]BEI99553.1 hypothetical protein CcaverHIS631_0405960 [Cutaneotrichosporon cavernicola]BEJ07330.1 hypothetical protein CcaverHIS641_0405990 [Cutaneotrichosporon cavernicola]